MSSKDFGGMPDPLTAFPAHPQASIDSNKTIRIRLQGKHRSHMSKTLSKKI
jgi:hypothetical protein